MTTAPDPSAADGAADRLNAWWDAHVRPVVHPGGRDGAPGTDLASAVARLHVRDDAPPPDPVFAARLWRDLVAPPTAGTPSEPSPEQATTATPARSLRLLRPTAGRPLLDLLAAALLLAVLGGGLHRDGRFPGFAVGSPTVSAHDAASSVGAGPVPPCLASPTSSWSTGTPETDAPTHQSTPAPVPPRQEGVGVSTCAHPLP